MICRKEDLLGTHGHQIAQPSEIKVSARGCTAALRGQATKMELLQEENQVPVWGNNPNQ